jgi:catechol 2,3-dioxygenase-like lactoylglutathione lyase family enzyme
MKITGADHTNWRVRDLERSLGFYRDVLGLEPFGLEEFNRCSAPDYRARRWHLPDCSEARRLF